MPSFKVGNAESGDMYTVMMDNQAFSLSHFKEILQLFSSIQTNDQIILIGPPFKRIDPVFSPDMQMADQKIYLFNKRMFSDPTLEPYEARLKPFSMPEVEPAGFASVSLTLGESASPLIRALPDYDRQYLTHLKRGEAYILNSEQALISCKKCVDQAEVQQASVEAAISNLYDHFRNTQSSFEAAQQKLQVQQIAHKELLDKFDSNLERLSRIPLHSSFQSISQGDSTHETGLKCLLDTLPVEKERSWAEKCREAHQNVEENMDQLHAVFEQVSSSIMNVESSPVLNIDELKSLVHDMEQEVGLQREGMSFLRDSYQSVHQRIVPLVQGSSSTAPDLRMLGDSTAAVAGGRVAEFLQTLEDERAAQEAQVVMPMETRCAALMACKERIAKAKHDISRNVYRMMRTVATIQTDIQFKLKKGLELMRKWRQGHNGYFQHLEHVANMPEAYHGFLHEVMRRQSFNEEFDFLIRDAVAGISSLRSSEILLREQFMARMGSHLPPIFFEVVPSLMAKPPFFTYTVTDSEILPIVKSEDIRILHDADPGLAGEGGTKVPDIAEEGKFIEDGLGSLSSLGSAGGDEVEERAGAEKLRIAELEDEVAQLKRQVESMTIEMAEKSREVDVVSAEREGRAAALDCSHREQQRENEVKNRGARSLLDSILSGLLELQDVMGSEGSHSRRIGGDALDASCSSPSSARDMSASFAGYEMELVDKRLSETIRLVSEVGDALAGNRKGPENDQGLGLKSDGDEVDSQLPGLEHAQEMKVDTSLSLSTNPDVLPKISFLSFEIGDIALFLPTRSRKDVYVAFAHPEKCPHRYLSQESLCNIDTTAGDFAGYILGKIIFIETRTAKKEAGHSGVGSEGSPIRLDDGVEYHLLLVEEIRFPQKARRSAEPRGSSRSGGDKRRSKQETKDAKKET